MHSTLLDIHGTTARVQLNHHQRNSAMFNLSRTICLNIIRFQRMISGGEPDLPSGETLRELSRLLPDITSRDCQASSAITICAFPTSCDNRSISQSCTASPASAFISIGLEGRGF